MRIYTRTDFMKLPAGTMYLKGSRWNFSDLEIKADTLGNDWVALSPFWPDGNSSEDCFNKLDDMLERGTSEPMNTGYGRDGCFNDDDLFLVLEKADIELLKAYCDEALKVS